jgi:DNA-binding transcriptional ArsR family regulator
MPLAEDLPQARRRTVVVEPSPALELFGVTLGLHTGRKHRAHPLFDPQDPRAAELARRVREFWPDEVHGFAELLVVAQSGGLLFEPDVNRLLAGLPEALRRDDGHEPDLASETPEYRGSLLVRMEWLRRRPSVRRRWIELLGDLWAEVRQSWEREGRRRVAEACLTVRRRLEQGHTVWDLDAGLDCWREEPHGSLMENVGAVVPSYFLGSWLVLVALPGVVLVGLRLDTEDATADLRRRATPLAERLKALADPTRLAILAHVSAAPGRITDVARTFGISQPTASVHFRVLRDAGLVVSQRRDGQTLYVADRRRLRGLQDEVGRLVVGK